MTAAPRRGRTDRRDRFLVAAGLTPGVDLSDRAQAALDLVADQDDDVVDGLVELLHQGQPSKVEPRFPERPPRLEYPNPAGTPSHRLRRGEPGNSGP